MTLIEMTEFPFPSLMTTACNEAHDKLIQTSIEVSPAPGIKPATSETGKPTR